MRMKIGVICVIGKIISIKDMIITIELNINPEEYSNMINLHLVFETNSKLIVGEIIDISKGTEGYEAVISLIGELVDNDFRFGVITKPSFNAKIRFVNGQELNRIISSTGGKEVSLNIGVSPIYNDYPISVDINKFFSNHFGIFGNTGSGKSHAVARIFQNLFAARNVPASNATILIFDSFGEYQTAFSKLNEQDNGIFYKLYTTYLNDNNDKVQIPIWLLDVDDWALLLDATKVQQLSIIDKTLKLVKIFKGEDEKSLEYKNSTIARVALDILTSGAHPGMIRDQIFSILTKFPTDALSLDAEVAQLGYVRSLKQCFVIDANGKLREMELLTKHFQQHVKEELSLNDYQGGIVKYTLKEFSEALEFSTMSEGMFQSTDVFDYANVLKVRLDYIINGDYSKYFNVSDFEDEEDFIYKLLHDEVGNRAQIVNFNINYVDDRLAKVIAKIFSKLFFRYNKNMQERATRPVHIILEESHRYVQKDIDIDLLGYNIFERITKEGRKFGVILGLITQRPSELSNTVVSQCSNFLIFKMNHPKDLTYIKEMIPFVSKTIVDKLNILPVGTCVAFGLAFKTPIVIKMKPADPPPNSSSADISKLWFQKEAPRKDNNNIQ